MNTLRIYDPFADARIDDLFRGFFQPARVASRSATPGTAGTVAVKVDVAEQGDTYVVHAELPGVPKDDIQVTIEGKQVTIAAEVKRDGPTINDTNEAKTSNGSEPSQANRVLRSERYYGAVFRSFILPVELDEATSEAKYENGVLQLTLKKKVTLAGRKLTIQ